MEVTSDFRDINYFVRQICETVWVVQFRLMLILCSQRAGCEHNLVNRHVWYKECYMSYRERDNSLSVTSRMFEILTAGSPPFSTARHVQSSSISRLGFGNLTA